MRTQDTDTKTDFKKTDALWFYCTMFAEKPQQAPVSFESLLLSSMCREQNMQAWCDQCSRYQPTVSILWWNIAIAGYAKFIQQTNELPQTAVPSKPVEEQGLHGGESVRLPPLCPGFDSLTRRRMWVEFIVGSPLCSERVFSRYSGFSLSSKDNISNFQFDPDEDCWVRYLFGLIRRVL